MRIVRLHNFYQQAGGEDAVVASETKLLERHGHQVLSYHVHNDAISGMGKLTVAGKTIWNRQSYRDLRAFFAEHRPDIAHFDNTFPLISPAGYYAARDAGVPVVQTLHNYRLMCPVATFFRDGHVCEDCLGRDLPWPGVLHACYRNDRKTTAVAAAMLATHKLLRTYQDKVDLYIALTEFARRKYIEGGLPSARIVIKPNFVDEDPGAGSGDGGFALFVGRLTENKGVRVMLRAWQQVGGALPLKIAGTGPLQAEVEAASGSHGIEYLGRQPLERVMELMGQAVCLVFPSIWYEGMPRTIVESYAKGTPVIASRLGSMTELIEPGRTGFTFEAGNADELAAQLRRLAGDRTLAQSMRERARAIFLERYTAEENYRQLMAIYKRAMATQSAAARP